MDFETNGWRSRQSRPIRKGDPFPNSLVRFFRERQIEFHDSYALEYYDVLDAETMWPLSR